MKIISWNVAGIKEWITEIERLMKEHRLDIVCLKKTRTDKTVDFDGFRTYVDCADQWSGVSTYVCYNLDCRMIDSDSHHLILEFDDFVLVNAYVPYRNPKVTFIRIETATLDRLFSGWIGRFIECCRFI